jgi:signal transduction histidine kinase
MSELDDTTAEQLTEIQALTEQTIQNLRRITRDLRPLYLEDLGLVAALNMLASETHHVLEIPVNFQLIGIERRLSPEIELALYRIAQECLSNISKHAQASRASISLNFTPETTSLTVTDDGCGFNVPESPAEFAPRGHFGWLGLHERAELIGASMIIQSTLDRGTRVVVSLPEAKAKESTQEDV